MGRQAQHDRLFSMRLFMRDYLNSSAGDYGKQLRIRDSDPRADGEASGSESWKEYFQGL